MQQNVWLVENDGNKAIVEMRRHSACEKCGACWTGTEAKRFTVKNPKGIEPGRRVTIELPENGVLRAAFIVYMIPLIAALFVSGMAKVRIVGLSDGWFCMVFLITMLTAFLVLKRLDTDGYFKDNYLPVITGVVEDED